MPDLISNVEEELRVKKDSFDSFPDLARRQTIEDLETVEAEKRKVRKEGSEDGDSIKWRSLESQNSSGPVSASVTGSVSMSMSTTSPDRKNSVESRSKVFRHKLQKIYSLDIRDWSVDAPNVADRSDGHDQVQSSIKVLESVLLFKLTLAANSPKGSDAEGIHKDHKSYHHYFLT